MRSFPLDDFADVSGWQPFASGQVSVELGAGGDPGRGALRMSFDFRGGGGFAVARKEFRRRIPEPFAFCFRIRGSAPANIFEFKLIDPSGKNVWRHRQEALAPSPNWQEFRLRPSQIEFAWGPAGGGSIRRLGAIEFVIAAGPGGAGTIWIEDLRVEDLTPPHPPLASASSESPGCPPAHVLRRGDKRASRAARSAWRPRASDRSPRIQLDFGQEREYGGLIIHWGPASRLRSFNVQASADARRWRTLASIRRCRGARTFIRLPGGASRFMRLAFLRPGTQGPPAIRHIDVRPFDFGRSEAEFLHSVAALDRRGAYPRYLCREQSYWTCAGIPDGSTRSIMSEEGMVEPDEGSFSLEPFIFDRGHLRAWADCRISQRLERGSLPIPSSVWRIGDLALRVTAFAEGPPHDAVVLVRYRLQSGARRTRRVRLFVAVRPFQVTPPWQSWKHLGGVSHIHDLRWSGGAAWVNASKPVVPLDPNPAFGAVAFHGGCLTESLASGRLPDQVRVHDPTGLASGAFGFDIDLRAGRPAEVLLAVPFARFKRPDPRLAGRLIARYRDADPFANAVGQWEAKLPRLGPSLTGAARAASAACRTAIGQVLINRDGPAIQPGPRRYTRSWIRDGAIMSAALLRAGCDREVRDFIRWYAAHQRADGFVPCCVDRSGPDWLVEHDSHGQLVFAIMEYFRFTRDRDFLESLWPAAEKACRIIGELRARRLGPEFDGPEKVCCRGLLPESASHEGYLAHPVHSYWDDFWAIRGLKDAATMARILGRAPEAQRIAGLCDALRASVRASLSATISRRGIDYVPGSVEWADFDPTATANAVALLDATEDLPAAPLRGMFARYLADFRKRRSGELGWSNYSAYEVRIIGALARLGQRDGVLDLLRFFLSDRRPRAWNQWPEISWRNRRSPGHIGDVPHTWIGAEFMLAFYSLLAFESETTDSLVVGAGIDPAWPAAKGGLVVRGLRTWHGSLDIDMSGARDGSLRVLLTGDFSMPGGGINLHLPLRQPAATARVNGRSTAPEPGGFNLRLGEFPAEILVSPYP